MVFIEKKIQDLFIPQIDGNYCFPYDIKFKINPKTNRIIGPAIYLITHEEDVLFIGSYKKKNNIIKSRLVKYVQTITNRGIDVHFGNISEDKISKTIYPIVRKKITSITVNSLIERIGDNGSVTTRNIIEYSMGNWDRYKGKPDSIKLSFYIFKPEKKNENDFIENIEAIKLSLIKQINPICNSQYKTNQRTEKLAQSKIILTSLNY